VLCFVVEWDKLKSFLDSLSTQNGGEFVLPTWLIVAAILGVAALVAIFMLRKNEKLKKIIDGFREGLTSVFKLQNKILFFAYSIGIWVLYFVMTYFVMEAFPETANLGFGAVLSLFAIGSIAMAIPLPGGAGSYHVLVPLGLVTLYHLRQSDASAFVFVFHGWQTAVLILTGLVSLVISYFRVRWKNQKIK
jgi:glycosyltransferase 2 family protein